MSRQRRCGFSRCSRNRASASSSGGGDDEMSSGFGFKKETYNTFGKERQGTIEEQSKLFGKDYSYKFDFGAFRGAVRKAAEGAGYRFEVKLMEKSV